MAVRDVAVLTLPAGRAAAIARGNRSFPPAKRYCSSDRPKLAEGGSKPTRYIKLSELWMLVSAPYSNVDATSSSRPIAERCPPGIRLSIQSYTERLSSVDAPWLKRLYSVGYPTA